MTDVLLSATGLHKAYGPVRVLTDVSFDVRAGEVHVLAGENGAGKSTLLKILAAIEAADRGEVVRAGDVGVVHQELALVGSMTVAENLFLGREPKTRWGTVDDARLRVDARALLAELDVELDVDALVEELPVSTQQLIEIARTLSTRPKVLLLDEPTSALAAPEAERLFERIARLRAQGKGIVYVSHKMDEIYRLADRITVLRDGGLVGTASADELPAARLVEWMLGRVHHAIAVTESAAREDDRLVVEGLTVDSAAGEGQRPDVAPLSFRVRSGEILGLAGMRGSGVSDVLHALFGDRAGRARGSVKVDGVEIDLRSPAAAIAAGLMLLPADRKGMGIIPEMGSTANASLSSLPRFSPRGVVDETAERTAAGTVFGTLRLRAASLDLPVRNLSGGNQQKVVLARCLLARPRVLLLDEPTRGVDVGAKSEIHALLGSWAREGMAIVVITTELPELLALSDRILVLSRGERMAELARAEATQEKVLHAAFGRAA